MLARIGNRSRIEETAIAPTIAAAAPRAMAMRRIDRRETIAVAVQSARFLTGKGPSASEGNPDSASDSTGVDDMDATRKGECYATAKGFDRLVGASIRVKSLRGE